MAKKKTKPSKMSSGDRLHAAKQKAASSHMGVNEIKKNPGPEGTTAEAVIQRANKVLRSIDRNRARNEMVDKAIESANTPFSQLPKKKKFVKGNKRTLTLGGTGNKKTRSKKR